MLIDIIKNKRYQNLSIKVKLALLVCITTGLALIIAATTSFAYNHIQGEKSHLNSLNILAQVVAKRSSAALAFNDKRNANENLKALNSHPDILQTCLYKTDGTLFTQHITKSVRMGCKAPELKDSASIENGMATVNRVIWLNDTTPLGTLTIKASTDSVQHQLMVDSGLQMIFFITALIIAFILTINLQSYIYHPITQLGEAANKVIKDNDYSMHIDNDHEDEVGTSITAFNSMLCKINIDREKLTQLAYYDPLTHLPNRRKLWDDVGMLLDDFTEAHSTTEPTHYLALMDMDNFKAVNDNHGHEVGDKMLRHCSAALLALHSDSITTYRLAGDEFVTVLKGRNLGQVIAYANSVLKDVLASTSRQKTANPVTFSIGISRFKQDDSISQTLHRADVALYAAKKLGRNRYVFSTEANPSPFPEHLAQRQATD